MIRSLRLPAASAFAVAVAIIVAACSSSATATPTPTPTTAGGGGLGGVTLPSGLGGSGGLLGGLLGQNVNPALQAKLPSQVCGAPALTFSMPAGVLPASALSGLAGGAGSILSGISSTETFSLAVAGPGAAASDPCDITYFAVQISGGDANSFVALVLQQNQADGGTSTTTSLGGKNVTVVTDSSGDKTYFTVNGDTAVGVQAPDDATAATAFAALP
jgi:hypothetical protein